MALAPATDEIPLALDNDILSDWRKGNQRVRDAITQYHNKNRSLPALPSVAIFESLYGLQKTNRQGELDESTKRNLENVKRLAQSCVILDFNYDAAEIAAHVCGQFKKNMPKNLLRDVFIAATALAHGYGVATRNRKDFERIGNALPRDLLLLLAIWKH
jgi:predicted nucleic acid-binding protein